MEDIKKYLKIIPLKRSLYLTMYFKGLLRPVKIILLVFIPRKILTGLKRSLREYIFCITYEHIRFVYMP